MLRNRPALVVFLVLTLTSAMLLAEMPASQETAERILKSRLEELQKLGSTQLKTGSGREYFRGNGEPTQLVTEAAYTLRFELSPLSAEQPPTRQIALAIEWNPDPAIKQTQRIKITNVIPAAEPTTKPAVKPADKPAVKNDKPATP